MSHSKVLGIHVGYSMVLFVTFDVEYVDILAMSC
jgi:hypothetical protein